MIIRPIERGDYPAIFGILRSNGMKPAVSANYHVAVKDGRVIGGGGWVPIWEAADAGWLCAVAVDRSFKRQGVGSAVVRKALQTASEAAVAVMWLETYFWNSRFYKSLAFANVKPHRVPSEIYPWRGNKHCQFMMAYTNEA